MLGYDNAYLELVLDIPYGKDVVDQATLKSEILIPGSQY